MRSIGLVLAIALQPEPLVQVLSGTKDPTMASHHNAFHTIIDRSQPKEVLNLIGHDISECIVVLRPVQRKDQDRSWRW